MLAPSQGESASLGSGNGNVLGPPPNRSPNKKGLTGRGSDSNASGWSSNGVLDQLELSITSESHSITIHDGMSSSSEDELERNPHYEERGSEVTRDISYSFKKEPASTSSTFAASDGGVRSKTPSELNSVAAAKKKKKKIRRSRSTESEPQPFFQQLKSRLRFSFKSKSPKEEREHEENYDNADGLHDEDNSGSDDNFVTPRGDIDPAVNGEIDAGQPSETNRTGSFSNSFNYQTTMTKGSVDVDNLDMDGLSIEEQQYTDSSKSKTHDTDDVRPTYATGDAHPPSPIYEEAGAKEPVLHPSPEQQTGRNGDDVVINLGDIDSATSSADGSGHEADDNTDHRPLEQVQEVDFENMTEDYRILYERNQVIAHLGSDDCHLFDDAEESQISGEELDSMIAFSGGINTLMRHLVGLNRAGRRFSTFVEICPAIRKAAKNKTYVSNSQRVKVFSFLQTSECQLFSHLTAPLDIRSQDINKLIYISNGLVDALQHLRQFNAQGWQFDTFQDLIDSTQRAVKRGYHARDGEVHKMVEFLHQSQLLSHARETIMITGKDIDMLALEAGGLDIALKWLKALHDVGRRFQSFLQLTAAVGDAKRGGLLVSSMTVRAVQSFLYNPKRNLLLCPPRTEKKAYVESMVSPKVVEKMALIPQCSCSEFGSRKGILQQLEVLHRQRRTSTNIAELLDKLRHSVELEHSLSSRGSLSAQEKKSKDAVVVEQFPAREVSDVEVDRAIVVRFIGDGTACQLFDEISQPLQIYPSDVDTLVEVAGDVDSALEDLHTFNQLQYKFDNWEQLLEAQTKARISGSFVQDEMRLCVQAYINSPDCRVFGAYDPIQLTVNELDELIYEGEGVESVISILETLQEYNETNKIKFRNFTTLLSSVKMLLSEMKDNDEQREEVNPLEPTTAISEVAKTLRRKKKKKKDKHMTPSPSTHTRDGGDTASNVQTNVGGSGGDTAIKADKQKKKSEKSSKKKMRKAIIEYLHNPECCLFDDITEPLTISFSTLDQLLLIVNNDITKLMSMLSSFDQRKLRCDNFEALLSLVKEEYASW